MGDPLSAASGMGATMSILSAVQTGIQYDEAGKEEQFAVQQDQQNENIANAAARDATIRGQIQAGLARIHGAGIQAQQKVGYAASGVDTSQGTPLQTMANTGLLTDLDAMTIRSNAAREAWGYTTKAEQFAQKIKMDAQRGEAQRAGILLSGMAKFASAASSGSDMGGGGGE